MKKLVLCIPVAALTLFGCHKNPGTTQTPAASDGAASAADGQSAKPLPPPPSHVVARADNTVHEEVVGEVNTFLTDQLRAFVQQKGRLPGNFAEFASLRLDSIPRPPEGRKWAIDTANLQVKAVAAQ
jgi:hypothetical protein